MNLLKKARLAFQDEKSDKVYEVDLVDLDNGRDASYLVNFRYGRRGSKLREGTKTPRPVDLAKAQKLFDSVVASKVFKGYRDLDLQDEPLQALNAEVVAATANEAKKQIIKHLEEALSSEQKSTKRARKIWRLAELNAVESLPAIIQNIKRGDWQEDYAIAWSIGRLKAKGYTNDLASLQQHSNPVVCTIAQEAYLNIVEKDHLPSELQRAVSLWPEALQKALSSENITELNQVLTDTFRNTSVDANEILVGLYQYTHFYSWIKPSLEALLKAIEFKPGFFKGVRAVFKAAELRKDADVFSLLAYRFEKEKHFYRAEWSWGYAPGVGYLDTEKEKKKTNSRVAYSEKTRNYFRRRVWRTLQRMGSAEDLSYLDFASALLLNFSDDDAGEARKNEVYRYERRNNRWENVLVAVNEYDTYAGFLAFNHILFQNSQKYSLSASGRAWKKTQGEDGDNRVEAFSALWDKSPSHALQLLLHSRCAPVHVFAVRILQDHPRISEGMSLNQLGELLCSPYTNTAQFALQIAKQKLELDVKNAPLITALLSSSLEEARRLGLEAYSKLNEADLENLDFSVQTLLIRYKDVQGAVQKKLAACSFSQSFQRELLQKLVEAVLASGSAETDPYAETHIQTLSTFIEKSLSEPAKDFAIAKIESLLYSRDTAQQLLGGRLLLLNSVDFHSIPAPLIKQINNSSSSVVRAIAAALLGKQSDEELAAQSSLLVQLYMQGDTQERIELEKVLQRIVVNKKTAEGVISEILNCAFSTSADEKTVSEIQRFSERSLSNVFHSAPIDLLWRSVQAKSKLSQGLGSLLLLQRNSEELSVKQWSILAKNPNVSLRTYAQNAFRNNPQSAREFRNDALQMLETDWIDTREFGFDFFREVYISEDWDPDTVIYLCDSVRDDVQTFGREVLQRFFEKEQGYQYLQKLSQHPSINVQLFASSLLEEYAGGHDERICSLRPYFLSVMSQVYRGRICKDRVIEFLLQESLRSQVVASFAAEIFERISLSVVHKDKSSLIKAMLALKQMYPELKLLLKRREPAIKATA